MGDKRLSVGLPDTQYWFERIGGDRPRMVVTCLDRQSRVKTRYRVSAQGVAELAETIETLIEAFVKSRLPQSVLISPYDRAPYCRVPAQLESDEHG